MGLLQRVAGAVLGALLFAVLLVFTSVILALAVSFALVLWGWFFWRSRRLRGRARAREGIVLEGEYRVESEVHKTGRAEH